MMMMMMIVIILIMIKPTLIDRMLNTIVITITITALTILTLIDINQQ